MKRLLTSILMLLSVMVMQAQQVVHTVQRGETLESIAQKYHVTKEAITRNNPNAADAFYVGMKLYIPVSGNTQVVGTNGQINNESTSKFESENTPVATAQEFVNKNDSETDESKFEGTAEGGDFTFMLDPDNKIYGLRVNMCVHQIYDYLYLSMHFGVHNQFVKHGTYNGYFGVGITPRYATGPILLGVHLYPYVNLYSIYKTDGTYNKDGTPKGEDKTKVGYGAILDMMAGFKVYTSKKGTSYYITGSYHVDAFEFKTKGAFKAGFWGVGISTVF